MKIVHICMAQYSDGWTYQENMLAKYHKKAGHDVTVLTSMLCYQKGNLVEDIKSDFLDKNGVRVLRIRKKKAGFMGKIPKYYGFEEILSSLNPDIIFSHGCQYADIRIVARYCKKHPKTQLYVDNHADYSNSGTNILSKYILHRVIWRYYAKMIEPYAKKFFGVLPSRIDFIIDNYGINPAKCDLLVMGADDEAVDGASKLETIQAVRDEYNIATEDFLIVTGGKVDLWKTQIFLLMEAVMKLPANIKLIVFGSVVDELKERVNSLVDGKKVQYIGWVEPQDSYKYFASADLVVFPGRHSVFWEQVAGQGVPMVVKDWPGTHHIDVGGNVLFVKEDSVLELEEKILLALECMDSMKKAAKAGKHVFLYSEIAKKSIEFQESKPFDNLHF